VKPERFAEAQKIKHCALSLVGEPIMYPEINKFIHFLHEQDISTFLVTNAQFPDAIRLHTLRIFVRKIDEFFWFLQKSDTRHSTLRECRRCHEAKFEENRSTPL